MEIERENFRELLLWLWGMVEKAETELLARDVVIFLLKTTGQLQQFDQLLDQARKNPSQELVKRHQEMRATIEQLLGEEKPGNRLLQFLRDWKPKGPIH
jgi:hypothetical protein